MFTGFNCPISRNRWALDSLLFPEPSKDRHELTHCMLYLPAWYKFKVGSQICPPTLVLYHTVYLKLGNIWYGQSFFYHIQFMIISILTLIVFISYETGVMKQPLILDCWCWCPGALAAATILQKIWLQLLVFPAVHGLIQMKGNIPWYDVYSITYHTYHNGTMIICKYRYH